MQGTISSWEKAGRWFLSSVSLPELGLWTHQVQDTVAATKPWAAKNKDICSVLMLLTVRAFYKYQQCNPWNIPDFHISNTLIQEKGKKTDVTSLADNIQIPDRFSSWTQTVKYCCFQYSHRQCETTTQSSCWDNLEW